MLSSAGSCACFLCFWRCCMGLRGGEADGGDQTTPSTPPPSPQRCNLDRVSPNSHLCAAAAPSPACSCFRAARGPSCRLGRGWGCPPQYPRATAMGTEGPGMSSPASSPTSLLPIPTPHVDAGGAVLQLRQPQPGPACGRCGFGACQELRVEGQEGWSCQLMELAMRWGRAGTRLLTACPMRPRGRGHPTASSP